MSVAPPATNTSCPHMHGVSMEGEEGKEEESKEGRRKGGREKGYPLHCKQYTHCKTKKQTNKYLNLHTNSLSISNMEASWSLSTRSFRSCWYILGRVSSWYCQGEEGREREGGREGGREGRREGGREGGRGGSGEER